MENGILSSFSFFEFENHKTKNISIRIEVQRKEEEIDDRGFLVGRKVGWKEKRRGRNFRSPGNLGL